MTSSVWPSATRMQVPCCHHTARVGQYVSAFQSQLQIVRRAGSSWQCRDATPLQSLYRRVHHKNRLSDLHRASCLLTGCVTVARTGRQIPPCSSRGRHIQQGQNQHRNLGLPRDKSRDWVPQYRHAPYIRGLNQVLAKSRIPQQFHVWLSLAYSRSSTSVPLYQYD